MAFQAIKKLALIELRKLIIGRFNIIPKLEFQF